MKSPTHPRHIVAVLFRRVGDSLMATPALRAVKECFPEVRFQVVCEQHVMRVFEGNGAIDDIVTISSPPSVRQQLRAIRAYGRPDVVLDFLSDPRSAIACFLSGARQRIGFAYPGRRWAYTRVVSLQDPVHPVYSVEHKLSLAQTLGCGSTLIQTDFSLNEADRHFAQEQWRRRNWDDTTRVAVFFIHSRRVYKRWPVERFRELVDRVTAERLARPLILATPGDQEAISALQRRGILPSESFLAVDDIGRLGAVLKRCRILIGNDGGPKHIAVALDVPTLTIFGKESVEFWTPPHSSRHVALNADRRRGDLWVSTSDVFEALQKMLDSTANP
ncbi:glycosyltransferase family 9 protein [bacterium]|nr:glycosyltransferase family 9 protein [bacterium]MBU1983189.1 glycosyltransferase family 9 protein [bacterium]